jgi:quinol monooxygenase YgiN
VGIVIVVASITLRDPAERDRLVADSVEWQRATRDDEPGCLTYCFTSDPVRDDRIQVVEVWESEEALDAHLRHANYVGMFELLTGVAIASAKIRKHRVDRTAPIYGADGKPTGLFD